MAFISTPQTAEHNQKVQTSEQENMKISKINNIYSL